MLIGVFNCHVPLAWFTLPTRFAVPDVVKLPALRKITPLGADVTLVTVNAPAVMASVCVPVEFVSPTVRFAIVAPAFTVTL